MEGGDCVDYWAINDKTIKDKFPIPLIEKLFNELHWADYFLKLDLRSGYHQILMKVEDIGKTIFKSHISHNKFIVMLFGLPIALETLMSLMNDMFQQHLRRFCTSSVWSTCRRC